MQITLNKIPFDVKPVEGNLRAVLLSDPTIIRGAVRPVWAWDMAERKGRYLVPVTQDKALLLPSGVTVFVSKAATNGAGPHKADGPTAKMAERFLAAVGAKNFGQVSGAFARVLGVPQKKLPFETFQPLNDKCSYTVLMQTEFSVLELENAGRNLSAYIFVPGLVSFLHTTQAPVEGSPIPGSIRPGFVLPPPTQAALSMRRLAVARRLTEMQAELGATKPNELPPEDPRRNVIAKLGAEWRVLQPKKNAPKAA
jgi:hypothetical protein